MLNPGLFILHRLFFFFSFVALQFNLSTQFVDKDFCVIKTFDIFI